MKGKRLWQNEKLLVKGKILWQNEKLLVKDKILWQNEKLLVKGKRLWQNEKLLVKGIFILLQFKRLYSIIYILSRLFQRCLLQIRCSVGEKALVTNCIQKCVYPSLTTRTIMSTTDEHILENCWKHGGKKRRNSCKCVYKWKKGETK